MVCADLILRGYIAFPSEQGLHYDVVVDRDGRLFKVQVKATRQPMAVTRRGNRTEKYFFSVRRCGKAGRKAYMVGDVDCFALVALDTRTIGYVPAEKAKTTMLFLPEGIRPLNDATETKDMMKAMHRAGQTCRAIARQLALDHSYVWQVVTGKHERGFGLSYLSDWKIEDYV